MTTDDDDPVRESPLVKWVAVLVVYIRTWVTQRYPDVNAWRTVLPQEWGDEYPERIAAAGEEWERLPKRLQKFLTVTEMLADPQILRWLSALGMRRKGSRP